jgi:hypothetical protein
VDPAANPGISSATSAMTTTPTNICGLKIYGSSISYTIHTIQCSNISNVFTTTDTLRATLLGSSSIQVIDKAIPTAADILLNGTGNQTTMTFTIPNYTYTTTGSGTLTLKNTTADSSKNTGTYTFVSNLKIIVDPLSITELGKHTRITTPSEFASSLTDFNHNSVLPDGEMLLCNGYYIPTSYDVQNTITEYNNYDAVVSATGSAVNYNVKTGVSKFDLTTYQFVTLKKTFNSLGGTGSYITSMTFSTTWGAAMSVATRKSGSGTAQVTTPGGSPIGIWYKLVQGSIETRWIDANSNINIASGFYTDTDYNKAFGGASADPTIVGTTLTNKVLTPSLNPNAATNVYIMIGVPSASTTAGFTNLDIRFP